MQEQADWWMKRFPIVDVGRGFLLLMLEKFSNYFSYVLYNKFCVL